MQWVRNFHGLKAVFLCEHKKTLVAFMSMCKRHRLPRDLRCLLFHMIENMNVDYVCIKHTSLMATGERMEHTDILSITQQGPFGSRWTDMVHYYIKTNNNINMPCILWWFHRRSKRNLLSTIDKRFSNLLLVSVFILYGMCTYYVRTYHDVVSKRKIFDAMEIWFPSDVIIQYGYLSSLDSLMANNKHYADDFTTAVVEMYESRFTTQQERLRNLMILKDWRTKQRCIETLDMVIVLIESRL